KGSRRETVDGRQGTGTTAIPPPSKRRKQPTAASGVAWLSAVESAPAAPGTHLLVAAVSDRCRRSEIDAISHLAPDGNQARPAEYEDAGQERLAAFAVFRTSTILAPYFCTRHSPSPLTFVRSPNVRTGIRTMSSSHRFC